MTETVDCAVIGAGVVGLAVARALALKGREVVILESEDAIGSVTSARNSEVIHGGLYYPHGSLKATLCVAGRDMMYAFCADHGITTHKTGKLVFAANEDEIEPLKALQQHAAGNGVPLEYLDGKAAIELEPALLCAGALLSPESGIVDSHAFMLALLGDAEANGAALALKSPVTGGHAQKDGILLSVGGSEPLDLSCRLVVNCAGLGAQTVSHAINGVTPATIPRLYYAKGSYFYLNGKPPFSRLIYPLPGSASLGLHYTLDLSGQGRFGPDIEWVDEISYDVDESRSEMFYTAIRAYWPGLKDEALRPGYSGVRPKIQAPGDPAKDFVIQMAEETGVPGYVALYGIESPGLTSSLAIADYVAERVT